MYNKLFTKILDSSIWEESDHVRLVWITFLACMDFDGVVALSSVRNVARRANIPNDKAEEAIAVLESPDTINPDQENEGRRIERIPGVGWFVLNAEKYRNFIKAEEIRAQTRARVAKHRAMKRKCNENVTTTESESESESDLKRLILRAREDFPQEDSRVVEIGVLYTLLQKNNNDTIRSAKYFHPEIKKVAKEAKGMGDKAIDALLQRRREQWQQQPI